MKGKRKLNGSPRDLFQVKRVPSEKKLHPTEKPTELIREIITLSTLAGEVIFDPFAGSGATLAAAKETNRQGIGVELDPIYHEKIVKRLTGTKEAEIDLEEDNG
jgi:site-specific DNA-methyltransferase (adenine-specific)